MVLSTSSFLRISVDLRSSLLTPLQPGHSYSSLCKLIGKERTKYVGSSVILVDKGPRFANQGTMSKEMLKSNDFT